MTVHLPTTLSEYFTATNAHDVAAMLANFAEDCIVKDEGREHHGWVAVRAWMQETIEKYDYKVEPIDSSGPGPTTVVVVSLSGKFPGSPISLRYEFTLIGHQVTRLEIG